MAKCYMVMSEDNLLPDVTETDIFTDYEKNPSDYMRCLYWLYIALSKRENYYERNSPTAFGDPEYTRYVGMVTGILMVTGWEEIVTKDQIIIKNKRRKILVVDRIKRSDSYYKEKAEINELLRDLR